MIRRTSLASVPYLRDYTSHRISGYDKSGGNTDAWSTEAKEKKILAHTKGPGCIKHMWTTWGIPQEDYKTCQKTLRLAGGDEWRGLLKKIVLRVFGKWITHKLMALWRY